MPAFTYAGGQYPVAGDSLTGLQADLQALAQSVAPRSVPSFATTTARNSAYAADIAAGRSGMRCWVVNRAGFSFYDGTQWVWEPQQNLIFKGYQPATVASNTITPGSLAVDMLSGYTLPPGNRQLYVEWGTVVKNTSSPANKVGGRVTPLGAGGTNIGIPDGRNYAEAFLPVETAGTGFQQQVSSHASPVLSGVVQIKLFGLSVGGSPGGNQTNSVSFSHSWMEVWDLGPTDN